MVKEAEEDLLAVMILIEQDNSPPSIICFHCQQAAEKFIKGFLLKEHRFSTDS